MAVGLACTPPRSGGESGEAAADTLHGKTAAEYEALAQDTAAAFNTKDEAALQRLNTAFDRAFTFEDLLGRDLAPCTPSPAGVQGAVTIAAAGRGAAPRRAGCGFWQLGGAESGVATGPPHVHR